jgi:adenylate cyclase
VRKAGARVRITAQLIDAMTGGHLWAERFDRELTDIFAVQDDVTTRIVSALELNLSPRDRKNIAAEHTDNPEAYDCFLRGRALWWRHAKAANSEAETLLRRAIELDPGFGPAYAFLGAAKVNAYASGWSASPEQGLEEAEKAARLAVQLDERYPFALWALAGACLWIRRHDEAVSAAEKVVAFNPSFAEGYGMLALILNHVGRSEEAVACIDRAMALDPLSNDMMLHFQGQGLYQLGRYTDAVRVLKRRIERNPETDASRALLAAAYGQLGLIEEAREAWRGLIRVNPVYSVEQRRKTLPYKNPDDFEPFVEGLRKAGLL